MLLSLGVGGLSKWFIDNPTLMVVSSSKLNGLGRLGKEGNGSECEECEAHRVFCFVLFLFLFIISQKSLPFKWFEIGRSERFIRPFSV